MGTMIKLKSRGQEDNYLKKLGKLDGSESKTYQLVTSTYHIREGYTNNNKKFIDPSGGPMIIEGEILEEVGLEVESIDYVFGKGYMITFK